MRMREACSRASEPATFLPAALSVLLLLLAACQPIVEERAMGDDIEMGPFVFSVEGTSEGLRRQDRTIDVRLYLDQEKSQPFKTNFGDFLVRELRLVDRAGNTVALGGIRPVTRNLLSAEEWIAHFILSDAATSVGEGEALDDRVSDFKLEIKNPDRRGEQPRRVSVALK